jgi:myosin heavy subunit
MSSICFILGKGDAGGPSRKKRVSVSSNFKGQLRNLMETIHSTEPHFIRCLKPNDKNSSGLFNHRRVMNQLSYGGVLETVQVVRSGYPAR